MPDTFSPNDTQSAASSYPGRTIVRTDWVIVVILALFAGLSAWTLAKRVPPAVTYGTHLDVYFSADCGRVLANMRSRTDSDHHRTNVHPLFSIIMHPTYRAVALLAGADSSTEPESPKFIAASCILSGIGAGIAMALFFLILRVIGTPLPDSVVYCALGASSAFALFWFTVPETYVWGAISILFALFISALGCLRRVGPVWYAIASLGTFAITTTNWSVGLLATWTRFTWRKAFILTVAVAFVASGLSITQKLLFPSSWFFFNIAREKNYVMQSHSEGPAAAVRAMLFHTMVVPELTTMTHPRHPDSKILRIQGSAAGGKRWTGKLAAGLWVVIFGAGIYALVRHTGLGPFRVVLGLSLAGQFALHAIYGAETFLYSAHFGPMMILTVAFLSQTRFRIASLTVSGALVVLLLVNNIAKHDEAMDLIRSF
jgi:hypothetical protein